MNRIFISLVIATVMASAIWVGAGSSAAPARAAVGTAAITMPADRFVPFAQTVNVGDTVSWQNKDGDLHTVVTVPGNAPEALNLTVKPAATATFTFTKPGLYWYYCNLHATWDAGSNQVKAMSTVDDPSQPMEGTILVLGAGSAAAPAQVVTPGDAFSPFVTTVTAGSTVTWKNTDADIHTVTSAPGNAPAPIALTLKPGASGSMTFTTPGLYWYYCNLHATWDAETAQVSANATSDEPSEPMMGVVAVLSAAATPTATASPTASPTPSATAVPATPTAAAPTRAPAVAPAAPNAGTGGPSDNSGSTLMIAGLISLFAAAAAAATGLASRSHRS